LKISTIFTSHTDADVISKTVYALKVMEYKMKEGSTLTESIFEDFKRRFSSEMKMNYALGDSQSFARAVFHLSTLSVDLTSCPTEVREIVYNGVIRRTSSVLNPDALSCIFFG
jgi:hypothetical protein